ncbi:hypothetical protein [Halomonas sp. N3-2A]|uniref:hypothetical protein n=1 Tax=Halomonas sp. N3-2A TaxID=2014541 RepID=UPI000B5B37E4|nr:hypothetical protein [Halomonas sp. N3-2A]ASK17876.1 hypothetical protein CEK60_00470 [Halomonas sp. N3-2A]
MNHLHADNAGRSASEDTHTAGAAHKDNVAPFQPPVGQVAYPAASLEEIAPRVDDILEAAKLLASAAKKLEKSRQEEKEAEKSARALQKEANEAFDARLAKCETPEARSFEDVQKDLLKALKRLDKAVGSASEETGKSQDAYRELISIITPSH